MAAIYHILIVEDDRGLREGIALALENRDYTFASCDTLTEARVRLKEQSFDLVLLDLGLPDGSGFELLKEIRSSGNLPVIILTANDMEVDEVTGLSLGASDYITKPFSLTVLRLRIEGVFRRSYESAPGKSSHGRQYRFSDLVFCFETMEFFRRGNPLLFSRTEQRLLRLLVENAGITLTREFLLDRIWSDGGAYVEENALSVTVGRLRSKLEEDASHPAYLQTVYGVGYVWKKQDKTCHGRT